MISTYESELFRPPAEPEDSVDWDEAQADGTDVPWPGR